MAWIMRSARPGGGARLPRRAGQSVFPHRAPIPHGAAGINWGVYGVPETYVVDGKGVVRFKLVGELTAARSTSQLLPEIEKASRPLKLLLTLFSRLAACRSAPRPFWPASRRRKFRPRLAPGTRALPRRWKRPEGFCALAAETGRAGAGLVARDAAAQSGPARLGAHDRYQKSSRIRGACRCGGPPCGPWPRHWRHRLRRPRRSGTAT